MLPRSVADVGPHAGTGSVCSGHGGACALATAAHALLRGATEAGEAAVAHGALSWAGPLWRNDINVRLLLLEQQ